MTEYDDKLAKVAALFSAAHLTKSSVDQSPEQAAEQALNRSVAMQKRAGVSTINLATSRPTDPMFYWQRANLPYEVWKPDELKKVRDFSRLLYLTHPVIGPAIDIFTHYPLAGMEIVCPKDAKIADFYGDLFLDQLCNPPQAPVWMGDYSFKPIGDVQVGDEVIGWETSPTSGRRVLKRSEVLQTRRRWATNLVKVTMESGREIVCTDDHVWANYHANPRTLARSRRRSDAWMPTPRQQAEEKRRMRAADLFEQGLTPAAVCRELGVTSSAYSWKNKWDAGGREALKTPKNNKLGVNRKYPSHIHEDWTVAFPGVDLVHVIDPTPELTDDKQRKAAAWLGGVYDGEGCGKNISQSETHNPGVRQHITDCLDILGIRWGSDYKNISIGARKGERGHQAARQEFVNFLNWTEPVRKATRAIDKAILNSVTGGGDRVVSVEPVGEGEVVSLTTSTGNYTAWGYASKNCYEDFLCDVGREYWIAGEAFPLGSFNELLGVWDSDDLMLPDDVRVVKSPFLREPRFDIALPADIRKIIIDRRPELEYRQIMESYPELALYATSSQFMNLESDERYSIPVSPILLQHVKRTGDAFHERGLPILLRAFRSVTQEEMLMAASDSIAQRLYTPLILATLGASASDMGMDVPWVPNNADLTAFAEDVNAALSADFRMIVHHFATDIKSVFGRENMPDLNNDFDRLTERSLSAFGLSKTMIQGASSGETYAADALNRDLVSQLLTNFQRKIRRFFRRRAEVVAEAQGHYDVERKGGRIVPIMEEVLETDKETGEQRVIARPKLLVPDLRIRAMNLKDEQAMQEFVEGLRESGVPISMKTRMTNIPIDLEDEIDAVREEQVRLAVEAQETRKRTYLALQKRGLPIPADLKEDFMPKVQRTEGEADPQQMAQALETLGLTDPASLAALAPTPDDIQEAESQSEEGGGGGDSGMEQIVQTLPMNRALNDMESSRPAESYEQMAGMPMAAHLLDPEDPDSWEGRVATIIQVNDEGVEETIPVLGSFRVRHVGHRIKQPVDGWARTT